MNGRHLAHPSRLRLLLFYFNEEPTSVHDTNAPKSILYVVTGIPVLRLQRLKTVPGDGRSPRRRSPLTARTYVAPHPTARIHQSPRLHVVTCRPQAHKRRNKVGSMRNVHRPRNRSCSDSVPRGHDAWDRFNSAWDRRVRVKPRRCRQVSHDWRC